MSDNGYDNIELNELINDLKSVGSATSNPSNETKITFQFSNASFNRRTKPDGINSFNSSPVPHTLHNRIESRILTAPPINTKPDEIKNDKIHFNSNEVDNLQKELLLVKKELAILKRSQSLAGHPIFGQNISENVALTGNFKHDSTMKQSVFHNSNSTFASNSLFNTNTPVTLRNNFCSTSNINYQFPNRNNFQCQSLTKLNTSDYSAHRENMDRIKQASNTYNKTKAIQNNFESYYDETEDCSLQPIGKGVQTLNESFSSLPRRDTSYNNNILENRSMSENSYMDIMKSVKSTKGIWLKLDASREACKVMLADSEIGSFVIRIQSDYKAHLSHGMLFELILKISNNSMSGSIYDDNYEYFSLKEFTEAFSKGFKLIGHAIEPVFPTLESFVIQHLEIPLGLPCTLKLPRVSGFESNYRSNKSFSKPKLSLPFNIISKRLAGSLTSLSSLKSQVTVTTYAQPTQEILNAELLFLGKITVDKLNGLNAIRHAVDKVLINGCQPKHCIEVNANFDSLAGISITDTERILFFKKFLSASCIVYCEVDPLHRGLNSDYLNSKGIKNSKIFGIIYQKRKILIKENKVIVFAEFNSLIPMEKILKFVKINLIKQNT